MTRPLAVLCCLLALAAPACADVSPGDVVTERNVEQAKDLISPYMGSGGGGGIEKRPARSGGRASEKR